MGREEQGDGWTDEGGRGKEHVACQGISLSAVHPVRPGVVYLQRPPRLFPQIPLQQPGGSVLVQGRKTPPAPHGRLTGQGTRGLGVGQGERTPFSLPLPHGRSLPRSRLPARTRPGAETGAAPVALAPAPGEERREGGVMAARCGGVVGGERERGGLSEGEGGGREGGVTDRTRRSELCGARRRVQLGLRRAGGEASG